MILKIARFFSLLTFGICSSLPTVQAEELHILTSYEADFVSPFLAEFSNRHPEISVFHLNKNTNAAVDELLRGNARQFDMFWASSSEAFELLDEYSRLVDIGFGSHADFAFSAVGWAWKNGMDLPPPQDWNDLLDPAYSGRITMSHPMRSGTTHSLIETILQDRGWEAGWAYLLQLAGQLKSISARSFGVLEGLGNRHDIGLTIDFLALQRADQNVLFRYGRPIIISPARIAALQGGKSPDAARSFIDFLLSVDGQRLLLRPNIRRIPIHNEVRAELAESLIPEMRAALTFSWSRYDPELARKRYWQVNEIYNIFIARDFLRRRDLWRRLNDLDPGAVQDRSMIAQILTHLPVSEASLRLAVPGRNTLLSWQAESKRLLDAAEARLHNAELRR
ncbi:ABC transporter substrate-binding protein [Roseinatronobacter alkalisoli]|uniref:Substrate-binding domain-containing protein n=1 Tax=Roseinatronobacter alkalisoli TaxID=3028235 RepID=A0ABT5TCR2_9RHOB|nr:ABC transporter substrate-binding protein [Roseinatronobacter sp. HJB301]MDD7971927.1 substrate-binding domain-containing protein [Roseinatronobacter sp. HJB301]